MPDLKANDKYPNIDGYVELTDSNGFPRGILKVQIKKLSQESIRKKQYSFRDDKFLTYCKESQDWIPILFIGVDIKTEKAYWLHIDQAYVNKMGKSRTVKFVDAQIIDKASNKFIDVWQAISDTYSTKSKEFDKYKKEFAMIAEVVTPALGRTDERFIEMHQFLDEFNNWLDYKVPFVKKFYYPNSWKIGLAYYKYHHKELMYTLYPIAMNKNDSQIKQIDSDLAGRVKRVGLGFTLTASNPIKDSPADYAKQLAGERVLEITRRKLLSHTGNEPLAQEFIFAFIDKFHTQMGLLEKDSYDLEEVRLAFLRYMPIWVEEAYKLLIDLNRNNIRSILGRKRYYDPDVLGHITSNTEKEEIATKAQRRVADNKTATIVMANEELDLGVFIEFLDYLRQANIRKIVRPYKKRDFTHASFVWDTLSDKDLVHNLEIIFKNLPVAYETLVTNNFPQLQNELPLLGNANKLLVSLESSPINQDRTYRTFYMQEVSASNLKSTVELVDSTTKDQLLELVHKKSKEAKIYTYKNVKYRILTWGHSTLDFPYRNTPLMNLAYEELEQKLSHYFGR